MVQVTHPNILIVDKLELVRFQLQYIFYELSCTELELRTLAYVYFYGVKAPEKLFEDGYTKSLKSIENIISKFRKLGLVVGTRNETSLHKNVKPYVEDIRFTVRLQLNENMD